MHPTTWKIQSLNGLCGPLHIIQQEIRKKVVKDPQSGKILQIILPVPFYLDTYEVSWER